ncbi:hypothetical protein QFZ76_000476 [Streptomyces sp. V4I2]|nr:hypothetical protein [Streptomyces sp. V4I2]
MLPLLCAAAAAVLAGARSLVAIGEWTTDAPPSVLSDLGFPPDPLTGIRAVPHPATIRRLLQRLDGDALDAAISAYLRARTTPPQPSEPPAKPALRAISVDGKTVRGSRTHTTTAIQLLAAMDHHGVVLAQRRIAAESNEIPAFQPLLDAIDLTGSVLTGDAQMLNMSEACPRPGRARACQAAFPAEVPAAPGTGTAPVSSATAAFAGAPIPSFSRIFFSISSARSGLSLRKLRAFSLP